MIGALLVLCNTALGLIWQVLTIVALYYGILLLIATYRYVSSAEKKLAEKKLAASVPSAEQAGEVITLLRSIEAYLEYSANHKKS